MLQIDIQSIYQKALKFAASKHTEVPSGYLRHQPSLYNTYKQRRNGDYGCRSSYR